MVPKARLGLGGAVLAAVLLTGPGCSRFPPPSPSETALRAGILPDAVPPIPAGAELGVAKDYFRTGNFGYAARYYEEAVALDGGSAEAWLGLAASYDRLRRFDLADRAYAEAAALAGGTAAYHNNVGFSYLLRGQPAKAQRSFMRALELEPDSVTIRNNLELLRDASHAGAV